MMNAIGTYEINLDTPIHLLTPRQLFEMQSEWMSCQPKPENKDEVNKPERWLVNKISELAEILGTSESTIYRMKKDGLLDSAISQYGKWMVIDVNKVLDIFNLSKRRKRRR